MIIYLLVFHQITNSLKINITHYYFFTKDRYILTPLSLNINIIIYFYLKKYKKHVLDMFLIFFMNYFSKAATRSAFFIPVVLIPFFSASSFNSATVNFE